MRTYTFLDENGVSTGYYWHTNNEKRIDDAKEMSEKCRQMSDQLGIKVMYAEGFIEKGDL